MPARRRYSTVLLPLWLALIIAGDAAATLTIYRIGGPVPRPTEGVEYVHLSWKDSASGYGGSTHMIDMEDGSLAPVKLKPGRNYARQAASLGGGPFGIGQGAVESEAHQLVVDGDHSTAFGTKDITGATEQALIAVDLGGLVPLNRVVFYPTAANPNLLLKRYRVYFILTPQIPVIPRMPLSSISTYRNLLSTYELIVEKQDNLSPRVEVTFPIRHVRAVLVDVGDPTIIPFNQQNWEVAELEIYGEGFVSPAPYFSRILDLGADAIPGRISWRGSKDRDARISIRTRAGRDDDPVRYLRHTGLGEESSKDLSGREFTRATYEALSLQEQAGTTLDQENWSFWSAPYAFGDSSGTQFVAPGPVRFVQIQTLFENTLSDGGELSFLEFEITVPPLAHRVGGEITPSFAESAVETEFIYALRPTFSPAPSNAPLESGFDRLVLTTPGEVTQVDSVRVNREWISCEVIVAAATTPCEDHGQLGSRVEFALPRIDLNDSDKLIELFFRARVFRFGTVFAGEVFDSSRPGEAGQVIVDGDATPRFDSNQLSVGVELSGSLLQDVGVSSPAVTPNGDSVNDEVTFQYTLLQLATGQSVSVDLFDLSGRRVRTVHEGVETSGRHAHSWDGQGDSGPLPPGIYLYRVKVDTDDRVDERSGTVSVVY